ncbi:hypothetical protein S7711_10933 [Stachybotrys chartarum IBT 7711]|uniref:Uncharacterized protein n=1 Tax=Stachybotrys chartarum (strain CBS 109288 / IBT 7711) TaxID=1280523 RepID=A0A084ALG5_STACB|nr:hypothetical protein S7711_10933 [Stachybotrys chartarum IBT 7711]KFA50852.1 hypothetical protein S40293_10999 [Stachybotrys chartarum IBT 40293]
MAGSRGAAPRNQSEKQDRYGTQIGSSVLDVPGSCAERGSKFCTPRRPAVLYGLGRMPVQGWLTTGLSGSGALGHVVCGGKPHHTTTPPHHHTVKVQEVAEWMLCCSLPHGNISSLITATLLSGNPVAHGTPPALAEQLYLMKT